MRIIIYTDGGLGNRLNSIAIGIYVAQKFNMEYDIYWPLNYGCFMALEEILPSLHSLNFGKQRIISLEEDYYLFSGDRKLCRSYDKWLDPYEITSCYKYEKFLHRATSSGSNLVIFAQQIPFYMVEISSNILRQLYESNKVAQTYAGIRSNRLTVMHYRGTDGERGVLHKWMNVLLLRLLSYKCRYVHICTDDDEFLAMLEMNKIKNVYWSKVIRPKKNLVELEWTSNIIDSNGENNPYNVIRDRNSIFGALVDLNIMTSARLLIYNSRSTFLGLAFLLRGQRHELVLMRIVSVLYSIKYTVKIKA